MSKKSLTYISCMVLAVYAMILTAISPLIPKIAEAFGLDIAEVGILFTFTFVGMTVFVPLGGYIADKVGKKIIINLSAIGITLALACIAMAPSFLTVCLLSAFLGGFGGVTESMIGAFVLDMNPEKPEYYVNMTQVFFGIGAIIGPLVVGLGISAGLDWRACYFILGVAMAVMALIFLFWRREQEEKIGERKEPLLRSNAPRIKVSLLFKNKAFLLLALAMFLYTGSEVGAWGWMCTYLEESFLFSTEQSTVIIALFWTALTSGRVFCGYLTKKFSAVHIVMVLAFLSAVFTLLSAYVPKGPGVYIIVAAMGLAFSSQYPLILSYAGRLTDKSSGTVFSLLTASSGIGNMVVPYLMGIIGNAMRMNYAMVLPAVLFGITGMIFFFFSKRPVTA